MSFNQLLDLFKRATQEQQELKAQPPVACPNDGEPLETGPRGELHCRFDGWTWNGQYDN